MNARHPLHDMSPESNAALYDAARRRAHTLRAEAIAAFWSAAGRLLRRAWRAVHTSPAHGMLVRREPRRS
jgi:hypothetical protein